MNIFSLNEKGMGFVAVTIAASMVVVVALVVANLVTNQSRKGVQISASGNCQDIANSIVEFIKKDEASLFITSYGPQPNTTVFPQGLDKTDDGVDRFVFGGKLLPLFLRSKSSVMSLPNIDQSLPPEWKYFNHYNIKNSSNRLIALAANKDFCCKSLDMNNPDCGERFFDDKTEPLGFQLNQKNVRIDLAINLNNSNNVSLCEGRRIPLKNIPNSKSMRPVEFRVKVTVPSAEQEKTCTASGSVVQNKDMAAPLTLVEMQNEHELCAAKKHKMPSVYNSSKSVVYKVKTVRNSSQDHCKTKCLSQIQTKNCDELGEVNLFNSFANQECEKNCLDSDPGSSFLCKVGEKNWFNDPANANHWEPCEIARIYDWDGKKAGRVSVKYLSQYSNKLSNRKSEVTTHTDISLIDLTAGRTYVFDVRAVDTAGNIGPSFCSTDPNSCDPNSDAHFRVVPTGVEGDCWPPPRITSPYNSNCTEKTSEVGSNDKKWPLMNGETFVQLMDGGAGKKCKAQCLVTVTCDNNRLQITEDTCLAVK